MPAPLRSSRDSGAAVSVIVCALPYERIPTPTRVVTDTPSLRTSPVTACAPDVPHADGCTACPPSARSPDRATARAQPARLRSSQDSGAAARVIVCALRCERISTLTRGVTDSASLRTAAATVRAGSAPTLTTALRDRRPSVQRSRSRAGTPAPLRSSRDSGAAVSVIVRTSTVVASDVQTPCFSSRGARNRRCDRARWMR